MESLCNQPIKGSGNLQNEQIKRYCREQKILVVNVILKKITIIVIQHDDRM
jgi:hypothetical protein